MQLLTVVERLWPDACHAEGSNLAVLLHTGTDAHSGPWLAGCRDDAASGSLVHLLGAYTMSLVDLPPLKPPPLKPPFKAPLKPRSGLNAEVLATLLIATFPEEFVIPALNFAPLGCALKTKAKPIATKFILKGFQT